MAVPYELLTPATVPAYLAAAPGAPRVDAGAEVRELSDGNLNLVFHVAAAPGGTGVVVKQALPYVRVDPSWPMTPERARHEAEALRAHALASPEHVPRLFGFDAERFVLVLEDLCDHVVWRTALNAGQRHEGAAADLGRHVARVAFTTSVLGTDPGRQKALLARSVNPQLCGITEDLVFTEPFVDHPHNRVLPANRPDVRELVDDPDVVRRMGAAKLAFMTRAEALVHGDLHTGSVMVRAAGDDGERSTKAIDSEFAFYGPVGFDLGVLWANYVIAAARAVALGRADDAAWCLTLPGETWRAFEEELRALWPRRHDPRVLSDGVLETLLRQTRSDAAVFAAAEAARRIIGFAKTSDVESLPEPLRVGAARGVLRAAKVLALHRHADPAPDRLSEHVGDVLLDASTRRSVA